MYGLLLFYSNINSNEDKKEVAEWLLLSAILNTSCYQRKKRAIIVLTSHLDIVIIPSKCVVNYTFYTLRENVTFVLRNQL
jgi:hypothetical protein